MLEWGIFAAMQLLAFMFSSRLLVVAALSLPVIFMAMCMDCVGIDETESESFITVSCA